MTTICMMRADIPDDQAHRCCDPEYDTSRDTVGIRLETSYTGMSPLCDEYPILNTAWLDGKPGRIVADRLGRVLAAIGLRMASDPHTPDEWRPTGMSPHQYRRRLDGFLATMRHLRDIGHDHPKWKTVIY